MGFYYKMGEQMLVVFFDLLYISSPQFGMITIADWQLSGSYHAFSMWNPIFSHVNYCNNYIINF